MSPQPVMTTSRLATAVLAALLATACASSSSAQKAPAAPVSAPAPAQRHPAARMPLRGRDQGCRGAGQVGTATTPLRASFQAVQRADPTFAGPTTTSASSPSARASATRLSSTVRPAEEAVAEAGGRSLPAARAQGDLPSAIAQWNDVARGFPDDAEPRQLGLYRLTSDHDRAQDCRARRDP